MGGGPSGPSSSQIRAQQQHEKAMMEMQMQMMQQQMAQQMEMLKYQMEQAEIQRLAAEQAAKDAAASAQSNTLQQAGAQNLQTVQQQLEGKNTTQQMADQQALGTYNQALISGAEAQTGGYDMAQEKENALAQLGAASGLLPQTPANLIGGLNATNPAETTALTNTQTGGTRNLLNKQTATPDTGVVFGGT